MINNEAILNPHIYIVHNSFCCRTKKDKKIEVTKQRQLMQDYWSFFQQLRYLSKNPNRNIIFIQNNCTKSKRNDLLFYSLTIILFIWISEWVQKIRIIILFGKSRKFLVKKKNCGWYLWLISLIDCIIIDAQS